MKRCCGLALAWALSVGTASTGARAEDADTGDLRCFVVGLNTAASDDASRKAAGAMIAVYYMGRLDGRTPDLDLKTRLVAEIRKMTSGQLQVDAARCSAEMSARAKAMETLAGVLATQGGTPPAN